MTGTYNGWLEFDEVRYFDVRTMQNFKPTPLGDDLKCSAVKGSFKRKLKSDCVDRADCQAFVGGNIEKAQEEKNNLEMLQRHDRKLREEANKRRQKGGAKILYSYEKPT